MNRPMLGLIGALVAGVAVALPADAPVRMTAKRAALQGVAAPARVVPEQMVGRLILKLRNPSASELASPMSASRVKALSTSAGVGLKSVRAMAGNATLLALDTPLPLSQAKAVAARLARDSAVEYAEPDIMLKKLLVPTEQRYIDWQWNLRMPTETYAGLPPKATAVQTVGGANLPPAWDLLTGSAAVTIAIIDTGIVNHGDLNGMTSGATYVPTGRFLAGYDFISSNVGAGTLPADFVANDGDGRDADPSDPGDWVTAAEEMMYPSVCDDGQTGPQNSSWHGSHMAGVAAATPNNAYGIAGIGWGVRILPVRALGKCGGSLSDIAEAIRWAAGLPVPGVPANITPAQVINLSLGGGTCDATMQSAVTAAITAGAVVVAATGNEGMVGLIAPANCNGVIAVTAHTINGDNADYANVGQNTSISSPGGGSPTLLGAGGPTDDPNWTGFYIWSTVLFGNTDPASANSGGSTGPAFAGFTGTSAATPQVSGVAALIKERVGVTATPAFIKAWLTMRDSISAHPAGGACVGAIFSCGKGLLNARKALDAADNRTPAVSTETFMVVPPNSTVSLTGTATGFPPATIATTLWRQLSGTAVTLNNANSNTASFTVPAGTTVLVFEFEATDSAAKTGADRVTVRVNSPPVLTQVPGPVTATVGQTVSFVVTATDPDGTTPTFTATAIPNGATLSPSGQFTWDTTGVAPGTYSLTYVASDPFVSSSPATVNITLNAVAAPPPTGGSPPPTGGGGGGGSVPLWQLLLLGALSLATRVRISNRRQ